jgi:hypothetical protein
MDAMNDSCLPSFPPSYISSYLPSFLPTLLPTVIYLGIFAAASSSIDFAHRMAIVIAIDDQAVEVLVSPHDRLCQMSL